MNLISRILQTLLMTFLLQSALAQQAGLDLVKSRIHANLESSLLGSTVTNYQATLLGEDGDGVTDDRHPNDLGMDRQATVFMKFLEPILAKQNLKHQPNM